MRNKRLIVMLGLTLVAVLAFWLGSRYPDLSVKAEVGPDMILDGLGFDVLFPVAPDDSLVVQTGKRTANWLKTNLRGMLFGLLIAAAAAGCLSQLRKRTLESDFANVMLGVGLGAPMGLCVNCAAPIATGIHRGGGRMETSLAAMIASPTLNLVVLSFLFTMLPLHLAMIKVGATLLLLLLGVPLMAKRWRSSALTAPEDRLGEVCELAQDVGWGEASKWSVQTLLRNLWTLFVKLGPAMVLAGALGSFLITVLPFELLESMAQPGALAVLAVALVGTFLPVPIAFDVIVCALLYQAGVPVEYVGVLLFTLGTYSVYSFVVVRQTISKRLDSALFLVVVVLGWLCGLVAGGLDEQYRNKLDREILGDITTALQDLPARPREHSQVKAVPWSELGPQIESQRRIWEPLSQNMSRLAFASPTPAGKTLFEPVTGNALGLQLPVVLGYAEHLTIPTVSNRSMASGDIHNDGWVDLVLANDVEVGGLILFTNLGGKFVRQELDLGEFRDQFITVTALVDLDEDGFLDLFFATVNGDNRILLNKGGQFQEARTLPSLEGAFVNAVGFADLDRDGDLDLTLGGWTHRFFRTQKHRGWNYVALQVTPLEFELTPLSGEGGNCHTVLLSDIDDDGMQDLALGNDSRPADEFYRGNGSAAPQQLGAEVIPRSTQWTMSLDSADLNNDLSLELFAAHIAYSNDERARHLEAQQQSLESLLKPEEVEPVRHMIATDILHDQVRRTQNLQPCLDSALLSPWDRRDCLFDVVLSRYWRGDDRQTWEALLPASEPHLRGLFERVFPPESQEPSRARSAEITQVPSSKNSNVLLQRIEGQWTDRVKEWGLEFTYWSWNAKFADLDLDGFQDLFLVNGSYQEELLNPNLLFLNQAGQSLERVDDQGTFDYFPTSNYSYLDWDNDGDLDIICSPPNGQVRALRNSQAQNQRIAFSLEDTQGLRSGIGARLIVRYKGGQQMKELKASGGFNSFDAPIVWFGLGAYKQVDKLEVRWSDGVWTTVEGPLQAGFHYRVGR